MHFLFYKEFPRRMWSYSPWCQRVEDNGSDVDLKQFNLVEPLERLNGFWDINYVATITLCLQYYKEVIEAT